MPGVLSNMEAAVSIFISACWQGERRILTGSASFLWWGTVCMGVAVVRWMHSHKRRLSQQRETAANLAAFSCGWADSYCSKSQTESKPEATTLKQCEAPGLAHTIPWCTRDRLHEWKGVGSPRTFQGRKRIVWWDSSQNHFHTGPVNEVCTVTSCPSLIFAPFLHWRKICIIFLACTAQSWPCSVLPLWRKGPSPGSGSGLGGIEEKLALSGKLEHTVFF